MNKTVTIVCACMGLLAFAFAIGVAIALVIKPAPKVYPPTVAVPEKQLVYSDVWRAK